VCETIALTVGLGEEAIDLEEGLADLRDAGSDAGHSVQRALAGIGACHGGTSRGSGARGESGADQGTGARRRNRAVGAGPAPRALPAGRSTGGTGSSGPRSDDSGFPRGGVLM
jgi:hypothetical protein